jgi:hypothetical protein
MTKYDKDCISEDKYREMLDYEEKLRKSDFIQTMYQTKNADNTILKLVQQTTLINFGFSYTDEDLENYRSTLRRFDRSTFNNYWIKNNIMGFPDFKIGQIFPNCKVVDKLNQTLKFPEDFLNEKPLVVIASSDS